MGLYINGACAISARETHFGDFPGDKGTDNGLWLKTTTPDFKQFIEAKSARRLSRIIKMGVVSSLLAMNEADAAMPDAIIAGTAYGCMSDTEKFLKAMIENDGKFLNPTPFIYSTHNTLSSQVALQLKCKGYNQTYSQNSVSFESALIDGQMLLTEEGFNTVLTGGIDEMTDNLYTITKRLGLWRRLGEGVQPGEGAAFFILESQQTPSSLARILDVATLHGAKTETEIENWIREIIRKHHLELNSLDLCLLGKNGDRTYDDVYHHLETGLLNNSVCAAYKHICGEYPTSSSFACWLAAKILKKQIIPNGLHQQRSASTPINNVLIYHQHRNREHGLILLQSC